MRRLLICLTLAIGCRSFEVRAFDVPISGEPRWTTAAADDSLVTPLAVVLGVAFVVGVGVLFYNYGSPSE